MSIVPSLPDARGPGRRAAYLAALGLLLAGVLKPVIHRRAEAVEYLVVFDVSLSMATEDHTVTGLPRSRLGVSKDALRGALSGLPAASRISLAGFAGSSLQVFLLSQPLGDRAAIEDALSVLEWDNVWDVGSRLDRMLRDIAVQAKGSRVFTATGGQQVLPSPLNVIVFSDGGGDEVSTRVSNPVASWFERNARVTFIGMGATTPSTVPDPRGPREGETRDCLRDERGRCLSSGLNEDNLQGLADYVDGRYVRFSDGEELADLFREDALTADETRVRYEVGWIFGLGSLLVFLAWLVI